MRRVASLIFGIIAVVSTLSLSSFAQEFTGTVKTVPNASSPSATGATASDRATGTRPLVTGEVDDSKLVSYKNSVPPQVRTAVDEGASAQSMMVEGHIILHRPQELQKAVDLLEKRLRTKGDPLYHQWLTEQELGTEFAPAQSDIAALQTWMKGHALTVVNYEPSQLLVQFTGTVGAVEEAFHTTIHDFRTEDGTVHYANTTNPKAPAALDPLILSPIRLNDFSPIQGPNYAGAVVAGSNSGADSKSGGFVGDEKPVSNASIALASLTLTDTPGTQTQGTSVAQTLTATATGVNGDGLPYGTLTLTGSGAIGAITSWTINSTTAPSGCTYTSVYAVKCVYTWNPAAALASGNYTLTAAYVGANNNKGNTYNSQNTTATFTVLGTTANTTTVSANPTLVDAANPTTTVTSVTTWTGSGATPTGTMTLTCGSGSAGTCTNLPAAINVNTCTISTTNKTITCSIAYALDSNDSAYGTYNMTMTYSGDATYAASSGSTPVVDSEDTADTVSVSVSPSSEIQGSGTSVTYTLSVTNATYANIPSGTFTLTSSTLPSSPVTVSLSNSSACTYSNGTTAAGTTTCTVTAAVPVALAAGSYTVSLAYSGDAVYAPGSATTTFNVTGSTTTSTTVSATPTNITGTNTTAITSVTTWTGSGATPTGSVSFYFSEPEIPVGNTLIATVAASSCTVNATNKTLTCHDTWEPATQVGYYGLQDIQAVYSGDATYASSTSSVFPVYYTGSTAIGSMTFTLSPTSSTYGTAQTVNFSGNVVGTANNKTTAQAVVLVYAPGNTSYIATGTFGTCSTSGSGSTKTYTCPYSGSFTVPATQGAGSYTYTAVYEGNQTFMSSSQTATYTVNKQTPATLTVGSYSDPYGTASQAFSGTLTFAGSGAAPVGTVTVTVTQGATNFGSVSGSLTGCTATSCSYTTAGFNTSTLAVGSYTLTPSFSDSDGNYNSTATTITTGTLTITADMTTLTLTADTPGSTTGGVTSVNLTATMTPAVSGVPVTFTDSTTGATYTAQTNGSGVATVNIATSTTGVSGGLNSFVASVAAGSSYTAATSNTQAIYLQGLLLSSAAPHDFSVCYTNGGSGPGTVGCGQAMYPADSVGTVAGSPLCTGSNGTNGYTCTTGYGVTILNFTPNTQAVSYDLINSNQGTNAFSYQTNCPSPLQPYGTTTTVNGKTVYEDRCTVVFYYLPPNGDGSSTTSGRYEDGSWTVMGNSGTLVGIGDAAFDRSGSVTFPATLAGFAVLPTSNPVSATPLSLTFGPQASGALSGTQNVVVTNNGSASIGLTFTPPTPSQFIVTNSCPTQLAAGASCNIGVAFQSNTPGTITGTLVITPAGASAITINLSGTVSSTAGLTLSTASHNFGNVATGSTMTSGFSITNNASTAVTLSLSATGSGEFTMTSGCGSSLAAGASCTVQVVFAPTAAGAASYTVTVSSNTPIVPGGTGSGPYTAPVTFSGTGVTGGKVTVSTSTHNFGDVQVGSTGTNYGVTLTNTTGAAVTLTYSSLSGTEFALVASQTNCGGTLANNASCQMAFSFTPTAGGFTSQLYSIDVNGAAGQVYSNAAGADVNGITLEGTGTTP